MKLLTQFFFATALSFLAFESYAQTFNYVTEDEYASLKASGLLTGNEVIQSDNMITIDPEDVYQEFLIVPKAQGCGGYFDPPGPALQVTSEDDGWASISPITLPFTFCFFGDSYNQVWMNNNGNISFNGGLGTFTPTAFPSAINAFIAGFWGDVDLAGSGTVHATITATSAIFNWVNTGYFNDHADKLNTFQIVITDGTDPIVQNGNVALFYDNMDWTTGDASSGVNGFGGSPATVGANRGNNIDYFQIGRFDHAGTDYDGPVGATDGVDWLDYQSFFFDFCTVSSNISPIPLQSQYCDTIRICEYDDTLNIPFGFLSPENNQTTTITYSAPTLTNEQVISNVAGVSAELVLQIVGSDETPGIHEITVTATDDGTPAGVTILTFIFEILDVAEAFPVTPELVYSESCSGAITVSVTGGPYGGYEWETGSTADTLVVTGPFNDVLSVTLDNGCRYILDSLIDIPGALDLSVVSVTGETCGLDNGTAEVQVTGGQGTMQYTLNGESQAGTSFTDLDAGTYWIYVEDGTPCYDSVQVTITNAPPPTLSLVSADTVCAGVNDATVEVSASGGLAPYSYSVNGGAGQASGVFTNMAAGVYNFEVADDYGCTGSLQVTVEEYILPQVQADTLACNYGFQVNGTVSFNGGIWSSQDTSIHFQPDSSVLNPFVYTTVPGNYTLTYTDDICGNTASFDVNFPSYVFAYAPDTVLCYGVEYVLEPSVHPSVSDWQWSTGSSEPSIIVTTDGWYEVIVANVCHFGSDSIYVGYKACDITVPNVISLSSTAGNNLWFVDQQGIAQFKCNIVNRWGNLIFSFDNATGFWDGTSNGEKVSEGTYFYEINAVTEGGEEIQKHGFIQVIE